VDRLLCVTVDSQPWPDDTGLVMTVLMWTTVCADDSNTRVWSVKETIQRVAAVGVSDMHSISGDFIIIVLIHRESKKQDTKLLPTTSPNVNQFSKFFYRQTQWQICNKFVLNIPTHLNHVATLPVKISVFKKSPCSRSNWSKLNVRLIHSKKLFYNICLIKYLLVNSVTKRRSHRPYKNPTIDCTQVL